MEGQESYNFDLPPKPPKRTYTKRSTSSSAAQRKKMKLYIYIFDAVLLLFKT
jgi:hypothetical protein